jgi:ATP-dependent RNA helicase DOB1
VELRALLTQERVLRAQLQPYLTQPKAAVQYLQPGRLAHFGVPSLGSQGHNKRQEGEEHDDLAAEWGWGVLVSYRRHEGRSVKNAKGGDPLGDASEYEIDVMLRCEPDAVEKVEVGGTPEPARDTENAELHIIQLSLSDVEALSSVRVSLPKDLRSTDSRHSVLKVLREVERRFPEGVPLLHPFDDLDIETDKELIAKLLRKLESVQVSLQGRVQETCDSLQIGHSKAGECTCFRCDQLALCPFAR